jgi:hypothetical protein
MLVLVMALQLGLIFALGERTPPKPRPIGAIQSLQLTTVRSEIQELLDPSIFARPHARGFSAASWLPGVTPDIPAYRWSEPTRPLPLPVDMLGEVLHQFLRTNLFGSFSLEARPTPAVLMRKPDEITEAVPAQSRLVILGDLAARKLLNPPDLPPWPADDLLTNSVVKVQVDESGRVFSTVLLGVEHFQGGSGSLEADRLALEEAQKLRFAPIDPPDWLAGPVSGLTRGWLIFQWRTVPKSSTNGVPLKSP